MGNLANVTADTFEAKVMASPRPVLVDFWAEWCGPCKAMMPVLETLASSFAGKVDIVKVNIEQPAEDALKNRFGIQGIPTLILFKDGEEMGRYVGFGGTQTSAKLAEFISEHA
ncbi:thioredoxin [Sphingobium sp. SCG-1]|nr:thioredoxin [Sphingobium sp. SCG-1]